MNALQMNLSKDSMKNLDMEQSTNQASCSDAKDDFAKELDDAIQQLRDATEKSAAASKESIRHALLW